MCRERKCLELLRKKIKLPEMVDIDRIDEFVTHPSETDLAQEQVPMRSTNIQGRNEIDQNLLNEGSLNI